MSSILRILTSVCALNFVISANAQEVSVAEPSNTIRSETKASSEPRKDIDEEITNARLRAATGAKSRISLQTAFNYNGASIKEPLGKDRPQLTAGTVENDPAKLTGRISAKYRVTDYDNLNLGIGVGWLTPAYEGQKGQMENPYIAYGRVFKAGRFQHMINAGLTKYTAESSVKLRKLNLSASLDHTLLTTLAKGFDVGFATVYAREFYSEFTGGVQDQIGFYPFAEKSLSDAVSVRTVYRGFEWYNLAAKPGTLVHNDPTQSLGLGISIARDLYLYPNIQWVWTDMRSEKTNVALSANINL